MPLSPQTLHVPAPFFPLLFFFFFFPCFSPLCLFFLTPSLKKNPLWLFIFSSQLKMKEEEKKIFRSPQTFL